MARHVPMVKRERDAIRNLINGLATYDDRIHALNVIDAFDNADDHEPPVTVGQWVAGRAADLRAVAQEWTA